jgi:hexosaminidase
MASSERVRRAAAPHPTAWRRWIAVALASALAVSCARATRARVGADAPSAVPDLVPLPASVEPGGGPPFTLTPASVIVVPAGNERAEWIGRFLADVVATATIPAPRVVSGADPVPPRSIVFAVDAANLAAEHYTLTVSADGVQVRASDPAGLFYGAQTLRQLLPAHVEYEAARPEAITIPAVRIVDGPRFAWRGAMLDVSRHFFGVADVKRFVDLLALHKLNRLHLHLTDDQGWRIEIASWPNLTAHGGSTEAGGGRGGYYTRAEYTDIVAYASDRGVMVVPEIDMPGHTNAALASYPELNCDGKAPDLFSGIAVGFSVLCVDREVTYRFVDDVVGEIAALTPGPYIHVGGDEVEKLTSDQFRQFIERVQGIVRAHGKRMIGWDEIGPATLDPSSIVQLYRPKAVPREAVAQGAKVILSPADRAYLDMKYRAATPIGLSWAGMVELRDAYDWEPATRLDGVPESAILGIEGALWTETIAEMRDVEYLAFPRLAAIAELAWSPRDRRSWNDFRRRLGAQAPRWSALGINFYRSPQIPWQP